MQNTTYYELSQIEANDKPTWLVMYNSDMSKIDAGIHEAKVAADNAQATATSADGKADTNAAAITNLRNALDSAISTLGTVQGNVNTLNSLMGNGTPTTSDQTVIGAINALEATIATSEDGANFANSYQIDEQFMRGGTLYEALTAIASGTAWSSLSVGVDYKVADDVASQIQTLEQNINTTFENKYVFEDVVTSVDVTTLATDTLADMGTKFYAALNTLKSSLASNEFIELKSFSVASFGILQLSQSDGIITPTTTLPSGYHFTSMDSEASKFNIREVSLGNGAGNASLTSIATGAPSSAVNRTYYDGTHVFGGTDNYLNYRKYKKISSI